MKKIVPTMTSLLLTLGAVLAFSSAAFAQAALRPVLECVDDNGDGTYTAHFGYRNEDTINVAVPVGTGNRFTPAPQDRGQTTDFLPGRQVRTFSVVFDGSNLVWTLTGPNGQTRTATASSNPAQRCIAAPTATPTPVPTDTPTPTPTFTPTPTHTPTPPFFAVGACPDEPQPGCKSVTKSRKAFLYIRSQVPTDGNRFVWNWAKGEAVAQAELGNPTDATTYSLCVYDSDVFGSKLLLDFFVPAGTKWTSTRKGFKYIDKSGAADGVQMMKVNRGADGKARVTFAARGNSMNLPRAQPVQDDLMVAQLWNSEGACWTSEFTSPASKRKANVFADYAD